MAKEIEYININGEAYEISKIYEKMGLTYKRFVELLERDFYCPTLSAEPTSTTLTYTDTDGSTNHFQVGQPCRWLEGNTYRVAFCTNVTENSTEWYIPETTGTVTETDPVFTASPAHTITASDITAWNDKMDETPVLNHGTGDTTYSIEPNVFHMWDEVASLNITLATPDDPTILNEYMFQFTSGTTATVLSLPSNIVWISEPTIEASKTYQISIVNNLAVIGGF